MPDDLYMTPPVSVPLAPDKVPTWKRMVTYDNGTEFFVDKADFEIIKHIRWYVSRKGAIINGEQTSLPRYLGIKFEDVRNPALRDYRRK